MGMIDPRWDDLAKILVNYSTRVKAGEKVLIGMTEVETLPLVRAVYSQVVQAGGFPQIHFDSALLGRELLNYGTADLIGRVPDLEAYGMHWADVYIGLRGARNPYELASIPATRMATYRQAMGKVSALRTTETRWVLVRVPGEPLAQQAQLSFEDTMDFFFGATLRDWQQESERYRRLARVFAAAETVHIQGWETDLTFSTRGRQYVVGDGHINMPDGEIYSAPVDDSAEGYITFEHPGIYGGVLIDQIRLDFHAGRVVKATARSHEDLLHEILATDEGAARIGEFAVGTNEGIPTFFGDILYDEKMAGTVHLALGRAYSDAGGVNQSAVHWDIVKDLRSEGLIQLDGTTVFENGTWLVEW
ncbi:aminopeptidase [Ktedonobacteria bacterium brp13]|nr:aminopeptidase [Ktedonobacteria bacterium brp13]